MIAKFVKVFKQKLKNKCSSVFIFIVEVTACLKNTRTNKIKVNKHYMFVLRSNGNTTGVSDVFSLLQIVMLLVVR